MTNNPRSNHMVIEGAGHYEMYDEPEYVDAAVDRLVRFSPLGVAGAGAAGARPRALPRSAGRSATARSARQAITNGPSSKPASAITT